MTSDLVREFFLGFVKVHVLYHATRESFCGTEMMKELRRHGYRIGPGTLYPILHRMETEGYLSRKERVDNGRRRIYYKATIKGGSALRDAKVRIGELVEEVM